MPEVVPLLTFSVGSVLNETRVGTIHRSNIRRYFRFQGHVSCD